MTIYHERERQRRKKKREKNRKNLVAPPEGWNLNHFLFRGEISLCSRRFCVSFEVLNRGEVARGLRRRIQVFLLKPLLCVPIELIDRYTLFLRGRPSSRSPPLSPPPPAKKKETTGSSECFESDVFFLSFSLQLARDQLLLYTRAHGLLPCWFLSPFSSLCCLYLSFTPVAVDQNTQVRQ